MIDYFGIMFTGLGSLFSTPQVPVIRPEVLRQAQNQMINAQQLTPANKFSGLFFDTGIGQNEDAIMKDASGDNISLFDYAVLGDRPLNYSPQINPNAIASQYNLTGNNSGTIKAPEGVSTGDETLPETPRMFDALSNMSGEETMDLISGLQGLLSVTEPEQQTLKALPMPGASGGLRLPEVDLMQYYKGLL